MSFGFSIGDILLISEMAYKLYSTCTVGRRAAGKSLKELEDVLFGLHCALNHLRTETKALSAVALDTHNTNAVKMRQNLDAMINSCGATLQELDTVTMKYREAADQPSNEMIEQGVTDMSSPTKKASRTRLKQTLRVNWLKVRWDMEGKSLSEYREKLQSHIDAINIVLNTFLWSATHRIEADSRVNAEKMHQLQNQALQSNMSLLKLVQDIHKLMLNPSPLPPAPAGPPPRHTAFSSSRGLGSFSAMPHMATDSAMPHFGATAMMAIVQPSAPAYHGSYHFHEPRKEPPTGGTPRPAKVPKELPPELVKLNHNRLSIGSKQFKEYLERRSTMEPSQAMESEIPKPSFFDMEVPTISTLGEGLQYIFRPFGARPPRRNAASREDRKKEYIGWIDGLDRLIDSWAETASVNATALKHSRNSETVDLLVKLNSYLERLDDRSKKFFYQSAEQVGVDRVLGKLQSCLQSVRGQKEIEEFEDEREEWKTNQEMDD